MIEFKNVYKKYDNGTEALKNVNLRIERGEFVFVVGASGSGKSTFLKTIMREEVPTSGTIMINNYDLTQMTNKEIPYFRRTMGIVFQDFRLIPNMTVYDNVAFAMRVIGANEKDIRKRVPYVLSLVGLQNKARSMPNEISGGEQQRVALARALVNNANTIIADEPTGNIDPEMSYEIVDLLNHINENGTTVIMVTHEHELVKKFNHRIVVIDRGVVVSDTASGGVLRYRPETGYKPAESSAAATSSVAPSTTSATATKPVSETAATSATAASVATAAPAATAAKTVTAANEQTRSPISQVFTVPVRTASGSAPNTAQGSTPATVTKTVVNTVPSTANPSVGSPLSPTAPVSAGTTAAASPTKTEDSTKTADTSKTPKTDYTTIDGVDYSKYFEDIDDILGKDGASK